MQEPRSVGEVFNIGNGAESSIRELAEKIKAMTDSDSSIQFVHTTKCSDTALRTCRGEYQTSARFQRLVGYRPNVQLDEILERVIDYWEPQSIATMNYRFRGEVALAKDAPSHGTSFAIG